MGSGWTGGIPTGVFQQSHRPYFFQSATFGEYLLYCSLGVQKFYLPFYFSNFEE